MNAFRIRSAVFDDLNAIFKIQIEASVAVGEPDPGPGVPIPSKLVHNLKAGDLLVAERDGDLIGFGGAFTRGPVRLLSFLYTRPDVQQGGQGVGRALLDELMPESGLTNVVISSAVHRAIAVYTRHGMLPRWPLVMLDASVIRLADTPPSPICLAPAEPLDPEFLSWDAELAGRGERRTDHQYWLDVRAGLPFWLERAGDRLGYAYIQRLYANSESATPHAAFIGPVAVRDPDDMLPALMALIRRARDESDVLQLDLLGPNPALPEVLKLGFRINYVTTFCCACAPDFIDPCCYVPGDTVNF